MGRSSATPLSLPPVLLSSLGTKLVTRVPPPPPSAISWCSIYLVFIVSLSVTAVVKQPFPKPFNSSMYTGFRQRSTVLQWHSPSTSSTSSSLQDQNKCNPYDFYNTIVQRSNPAGLDPQIVLLLFTLFAVLSLTSPPALLQRNNACPPPLELPPPPQARWCHIPLSHR